MSTHPDITIYHNARCSNSRGALALLRERGIEPKTIASFMQSMKMDTHVSRYETYRDLEVYTYGSAAVVGLMMCRIAGVTDERATPHAEALGVAMQLSNFLRDMREDWRRGRVYVPMEDLARFGYTISPGLACICRKPSVARPAFALPYRPRAST